MSSPSPKKKPKKNSKRHKKDQKEGKKKDKKKDNKKHVERVVLPRMEDSGSDNDSEVKDATGKQLQLKNIKYAKTPHISTKASLSLNPASSDSKFSKLSEDY